MHRGLIMEPWLCVFGTALFCMQIGAGIADRLLGQENGSAGRCLAVGATGR